MIYEAMRHRIKTRRGEYLRTGNEAEKLAIEQLTLEGWEVYKRGWPDLLAVKGGEVRMIEVKPTDRHRLSKFQKAVSEILRAHYLDVELWSPPAVAVREDLKG